MPKSNYTDVLLEDVGSKFDRIMEAIRPLKELPAAVKKLQEDVDQLKSDMAVIKLVVTDHGKVLKNHESRLIVLESH